jgi:hypothetical protein
MSRRKIKTRACACCGQRLNKKVLKPVKGSSYKGEPALVCQKCLTLPEEEHQKLFGDETTKEGIK